MALKFRSEPPPLRAPWFSDDIAASRDKLLSAIGQTNDLTLIRGYGNIGDGLIYAGTRQLLGGLRWREVSIRQLDGVRGHTALVAGGGAWCRPYHDMPQYLPQIEAQFRRVVILPSSFDVSEDCVRAALAETKALVFARERESYRQIRDLCHADLAHDCSFFFDYESYRRPGEGRLFAYRTDCEADGQPLPEDNRDLSVTCESLDQWLWTIAQHAEVYTDRAHVMIAAAMLGKRVMYRASTYHKVPAIAEYALASFPVRRATAPAQHDDDEDSVREALLHTARQNLQLLPVDFFANHRRPVVTVVMLSWNRLEQTLRAVQALREYVRIPFRLLLLDNHSDADTQAALQALASEHDFIELYLLPENLGAAGGRNHALSYVRTEYLLLLDNDVEVFPGTVEHLLWKIETQPDAVAVTGRVVFPNGRVHLCGADFHTAGGLLHYELLGFGQHYAEPPGVSGACGWVPGCLTLVRTEVMLEQQYDLGMKNYYEDLEWCYRLNEQGLGRFYRSVEALGLHHHEVKGADAAASPTVAHAESMRFVETIAYFYSVHGQIIPNLFSFVPELGEPDDPQSVAAARLLLTLVESCGSEWALREWNDGRLHPLFGRPQFAQLSAQLATEQATLEKTQAERERVEAEAVRLLAELQATQTQLHQQTRECAELHAQVQQHERAREELQTQFQQKARTCEELEARLQQQGREREDLHEQLQQQMQSRSELETQLRQQTQAGEELQAHLQQRISELGQIRQSRYWRALEAYWRMRDRLLRRN